MVLKYPSSTFGASREARQWDPILKELHIDCNGDSPIPNWSRVARRLKFSFVWILAILLVAGVIFLIFSIPSKKREPADQFDLTVDRLNSLAEACRRFHRGSGGLWPSDSNVLLSSVQLKHSNDVVDAWGHAIVFITVSQVTNVMWLKSYGADGLPDGIGEAADIIFEVQ